MEFVYVLRCRTVGVAVAALSATVLSAPLPASAAPQAATLSPDALVSSDGRVLLTSSPSRRSAEFPRGRSGSVGRTGADQGIESIIGTDERVRVKNTLAFPGSATVLIRQFGRLHCTGWMVSKDTLMTAGHCVRDGGSDG